MMAVKRCNNDRNYHRSNGINNRYKKRHKSDVFLEFKRLTLAIKDQII